MDCPHCKLDNRAGRLFCRGCGGALPAPCARCGFHNDPSDRFCGGCGTPLALATASRATAAPARAGAALDASADAPAMEGERRQLTVMFCDLADSVSLSERLDPEDLRAVIRAFQACCAMVIANFDGHVAKYLGDGILAYFGYPEPHEDDPERAVRSGLGIVEAVKKLRFPGGLQLHVRVGISTGLVVVGDIIGEGAAREEAVSGDIPNRAARLQAIAEPDSVLIGNVVRRLIGGLFECVDLGKQLLKGFSEPMRVWRVIGESSAESRFEAIRASLSPLVGRSAEMHQLLGAWTRARQSSGCLVLIGGEAGIGKSRLLEELRQVLAPERMTVLGYQCSPHHKDSALYPVIAQVERAAGFERSDDSARRLARLGALVTRWSAQPDRLLPVLANLLSLPLAEGAAVDPEWQREATLATIVALIEEQARREPLLLSFEDAHWMDATTLRLVSLLVPRVRQLPVLIVVTHRPDFVPPWPGAAHVELIDLRRLAARDCATIVSNLTGGKAMPASLLLRLVGRSDGVPLYVEELTKAVLAAEQQRGGSSEKPADSRAAALAVPDTLQDSLLARLGSDPAAKEVAQAASAIGRQFSHELLLGICPLPAEETEAALQRLIRSELVFRRGVPPRATYRFKHALLQDAAYATLLRRRRLRLHTRIAETLEQRFPETVQAEPEVLAHHWSEAGAAMNAACYWLRAGEREIGGSAMVEARSHLRRAAELLATLPETPERLAVELDVQCGLGAALQALSGPSAEVTAAAYRRARALAEQTGRTDRLLHVLYGLGVYHFVRAEFTASRQSSEELLRAAEAQDDAHGRATAHRCVGADLFMLGRFADSRGHLEQALKLQESAELSAQISAGYAYDSTVVALGYLSWTVLILGYPDTSQALCRRLLGRARALNHPHTLAYALDAACTLFQLFGVRRHVERQAARLLALTEKHDFAFWRAQGMMYRAWAATEGPDGEAALKALRDGMEAHWATGAQVFTPFHQGLLAAASIRTGGLGDADDLITQALSRCERTAETWFGAELHRIRAGLHLRRGAEAEAEADLTRALAIARDQGARLWELRAARDLAKLWHTQSRGPAAFDLLRPVHAAFTEGERMAELLDARGLLEDLWREELAVRALAEA